MPFHTVFFLQDDHDYFDNDEADDKIVTFPPDHFMLALARNPADVLFRSLFPIPIGRWGSRRFGSEQALQEVKSLGMRVAQVGLKHYVKAYQPPARRTDGLGATAAQ
jgi:hypothetical protein